MIKKILRDIAIPYQGINLLEEATKNNRIHPTRIPESIREMERAIKRAFNILYQITDTENNPYLSITEKAFKLAWKPIKENIYDGKLCTGKFASIILRQAKNTYRKLINEYLFALKSRYALRESRLTTKGKQFHFYRIQPEYPVIGKICDEEGAVISAKKIQEAESGKPGEYFWSYSVHPSFQTYIHPEYLKNKILVALEKNPSLVPRFLISYSGLGI